MAEKNKISGLEPMKIKAIIIHFMLKFVSAEYLVLKIIYSKIHIR